MLCLVLAHELGECLLLIACLILGVRFGSSHSLISVAKNKGIAVAHGHNLLSTKYQYTNYKSSIKC
jgi:hypothetical protein